MPDYLIEIICKNNKLFHIDIDNIVKIFEIKKCNIKHILVNNFIQNIDYEITNKKIIKGRGRTKEIILLKNLSFKKLCTILINKKAKKFCDYIILIEEYINQYKDYIIESLKIITPIEKKNEK
jgi:hypothetical protein